MLQTAKVLQTATFSPSFVPPVAKIGRNTARPVAAKIGIDRTGDARLWKLHDEFCREYAKMRKLNTPASDRGSLPSGKPSERRAFDKFEAQMRVVDRVASKIARCPAKTVTGMLMKVQLSAHLFDWVGRSFTGGPYTAHEGLWIAKPFDGLAYVEHDLISSLRDDLLRLQARGGSR